MKLRCILVAALALGVVGCEASDAEDSGDASAPTTDAAPDAAWPRPDAASDASEPDASGGDAGDEMDASVAGWCATSDTALGRIASTLAPGEWGELAVDPSLLALNLHNHLTSWSDTGVWNPVTRRVQWIGSPGACCADPSRYDLIVYDVTTDTWSVELTPWPDNVGHAYDGNAIDPATGIHYFARSSNIRGYDGEGWIEVPSPGRQPVAVGLTWFSSRGWLVLVGRGVSTWDGTEWTSIPMEGVTFGTYHMFAEYNPVLDVAWLGAGNGGANRSAVLRSDGTLTQLADAPVSLNATGASMKTYDPSTGLYIVESNEDRWFTFDIIEDVWTEITDEVRAARPDTWILRAYDFVTPIDDCGVLFYFQARGGVRRLHVYRPPARPTP